jgi:hypothetical protein
MSHQNLYYDNGSLGGAVIAVSVPLFILGCGIEFSIIMLGVFLLKILVVDMVSLPFSSTVTAGM